MRGMIIQKMNLILKIVDSDNSGIRGMRLEDGKEVFSVYDFIKKVCDYTDYSGACKLFSRLISDDSQYKEEIMKSYQRLRFIGQRGPKTPCMTIRDLQQLLM